MTRDNCRSVGAMTGLAALLGVAWALGFVEMLPMAVAGSAGAVAGGVLGEQWHDRSQP
ncbi:MAG: hypothetical protein AAF670_19690 [Planctomycetota bacterium]